MDKKIIKKIQEVFLKYPKVKLAYFFGSRNRGKFNKNSDYDFAVYIEEKDAVKSFKIRLQLMNDLASILKNDDIDVVTLNDVDNPVLKFEIVKEGTLLYQVEPYKVILEPKILEEYFDFQMTFRRN